MKISCSWVFMISYEPSRFLEVIFVWNPISFRISLKGNWIMSSNQNPPIILRFWQKRLQRYQTQTNRRQLWFQFYRTINWLGRELCLGVSPTKNTFTGKSWAERAPLLSRQSTLTCNLHQLSFKNNTRSNWSTHSKTSSSSNKCNRLLNPKPPLLKISPSKKYPLTTFTDSIQLKKFPNQPLKLPYSLFPSIYQNHLIHLMSLINLTHPILPVPQIHLIHQVLRIHPTL